MGSSPRPCRRQLSQGGFVGSGGGARAGRMGVDSPERFECSGGRGPEEAEAEEADMVLPRASVVVRSHCFASTVLGRMGGLLAALEP